jgi:ZIP family zinc transporter
VIKSRLKQIVKNSKNPVLFLYSQGIAGIMVFICENELLPAAREYSEHHLSIYGLVAGMAVMAVSLLMFM